MSTITWTIEELFDVLLGETSNYNFFVYINSGWLKMQFDALYGSNPSEQDYWDWMFKNAERITLSAKDFDSLTKLLDS
jgi:hypothetical protein